MSDTTTKPRRHGHTAGLLDIRNIIGTLLFVDGVLILLTGIFGDTEEDKTGGVNANLWAGIMLVAVGVFFIVWCRLRPVVVPDHVEPADKAPPGH